MTKIDNRNVKLLILDDSELVAASLSTWLKDEGFIVYTCSNKEDAVEIIKNNDISICLVDLRLKDEDGVEVSQHLKSLDKSLRIIIITGFPTYETAVDAIKSGVFDYVSKSLDNESILNKIEKALEDRKFMMMENRKDLDKHKNICLICNHLLVKEGLSNFCKKNPEFNFLHSYHNFEFIKKTDFNSLPLLVLICESCNKLNQENPEPLFEKIQLVFPNSKTLILNSELSEEKKLEFINWGVKGFLESNVRKSTLKKVFLSVLDGQLWIDRKLSNKIISNLAKNPKTAGYKIAESKLSLSNREVEILQAVATGLSNFEISENFFLSEKTVKTHLHNIFKKMNVKTRTEAVSKAYKEFII